MKVTGLFRYPVKSLRGHALETAEVEPIGFAGDRRWLVVGAGNRFQTIREIPKMTQIDVGLTPTGLILSHQDHGACAVDRPLPVTPAIDVSIWGDIVPTLPAKGDAGKFLSGVLGVPVWLGYLANPAARPVDPRFGSPGDHVSFADGYPMLLTNEASLDDLSARLGQSLDMRRFRPNIVIDGLAPFEEDSWKEIAIGGVRFRVAKPCGRCVVVTRDPDTGVVLGKGEPLKTLAKFHSAANGGIIFGQNLIPDGTGTLRLGDPVEIIASGRSNLLAAE